jgi:hypothetical protein
VSFCLRSPLGGGASGAYLGASRPRRLAKGASRTAPGARRSLRGEAAALRAGAAALLPVDGSVTLVIK